MAQKFEWRGYSLAEGRRERLEIKLDQALRVQEEEPRRGKVDPLFAKPIEGLQKRVAKIRRYGSPA